MLVQKEQKLSTFTCFKAHSLTHQKRFRVNRFRRCFEPVHCFWTGSCTIELAVVVLEVVHVVMGALNRFKNSVSRRSSLWTGSTFVNRFNVCELVQTPLTAIWHHYKRAHSTMHAPCIMIMQAARHARGIVSNKSTACWKQNILKLLLPPSNVQSKYSRKWLALNLPGCEPQLQIAYLAIMTVLSSNAQVADSHQFLYNKKRQ